MHDLKYVSLMGQSEYSLTEKSTLKTKTQSWN